MFKQVLSGLIIVFFVFFSHPVRGEDDTVVSHASSAHIDKTFAVKPALSANARFVRNINRTKKRVPKNQPVSYVDNIAIVFNGAPLYPFPHRDNQNKTVIKNGLEYAIQLIDGNDKPDAVPEESYLVIDCKGLEFAIRTQDGQYSEGSHVALHMGSIRPTEIKPEDVTSFTLWVSAKGDAGPHSATIRLVFKNGVELKRDLKVIVQ